MPLSPGARLGPYEIVASLGAGGMGEVYRARDPKLNRDVAIKVLPTSVAQDPERLARFRREAQVLAALNHPNIAHIHGFEDSTDAHGLVMELVEGPTLADLLATADAKAASVSSRPKDTASATVRAAGASRGLKIDDALAIARQIAEAIEAAHEQGIIHRDLKPSNIKVRDDGTVKVLDFGLAKALTPEPARNQSDPSNSPTLTAAAFGDGTQMGVILGTAAYMAPEQAKGRAVDRRADIWAFGVILFEMLSGRRGYEAEDISETIAAVLTREVDWTALPPATPTRLKTLVKDCLVRDPKQRLRDIGEARRALERMIAGDDMSSVAAVTSAPAAPRRRSLPWAIAAVAVVIAAVSAWNGLRPRAPAATPRVTRSETGLKEISGFIGMSTDGTKIAYAVAGGAKTTYLVFRAMDQFDAKPIPGTEGGAWPLFSPNGDWIAYTALAEARILRIPVGGGAPIPVSSGSFAGGAAWSADDSIVFSGSGGLVKVAASGGTPAPLTKVDKARGEIAHSRPQYLPGDKQLLFTVDTNSGSQFAVLDLSTGTHRTIARGGLNGKYLTSGHLTYVRANTMFAVPFDIDTMTSLGTEVPVIERVSQVGPPGQADYAVSPDGLLVYFVAANNAAGGGSSTTLMWADGAGRTTPLPGQSTTLWGTGRLSPNGQFVANGISGTPGNRDIWIFDVARGTPRRVTSGGSNDFPVWTADSSTIYFSGTADGKTGIFRAPADGSRQPEFIIATPAGVSLNCTSPDGRLLIYTQQNTDGAPRLMALDIDAAGKAGEPRRLHDSPAADFHGEISPDGKWIAYASAESGAPEIYVHAFPKQGARVRISTDGGSGPRWSRDSKALLFQGGTPPSRIMSVDIPQGDPLRAGAPKQLFQVLMGTTWDVTPDRNKFLIELSPSSDGMKLATVTNWFEELKLRAPAKKQP